MKPFNCGNELLFYHPSERLTLLLQVYELCLGCQKSIMMYI